MIDYIKPVKLKKLVIENNIWQAPLAGYSSMPFRILTWRLGRPGLLATEMISARAVEQKNEKQEQYLIRSEQEGPVAYQLWGCNESAIEYAAGVVEDRGADVVDLNCGCPVKKVRAAGAGSKLMEDPLLIARLIKAMRRGVKNIPVTIKIRVGTSDRNYNGVEVAKIAEDAGVDLITVHGRHACERYSHSVRYEKIQEIVEAVKIPIIGNGDVCDGVSAKEMFDRTGCAGVMVGRACMGSPWIFDKIKLELSGNDWVGPDKVELASVMLEHYDLLVSLVGKDRAIRQSRKLGAFYSKGIIGARSFRNKLNNMKSREDLEELVNMLMS